MVMKRLHVLGGMGVLAVLGLVLSTATGADEKQLTIKEIMKKGHDGKPALCKKVADGKASKEEKQELLDLYIALAKTKPPMGDADAWKAKCDALVAAAKKCVADDKDGIADFKKAVACKACHEAHKKAKK
jgi:hypothetical protein